MRIVVDATAAVAGGKLYLTQLLNQFARMEIEHELIVFYLAGDDVASPELKERFRFIEVALPGSGNVNRITVSIGKMMWRIFALPWHLHRLKADLLFSNAGFGPGWRPKRTKLALALHNSMPFQDKNVWAGASFTQRLRLLMLRRLISRAVRECDALIVFSRHLKDRVAMTCGPLKRPASVIYYGLDWGEEERRLNPDVAQLSSFGLRRPYLLYVSHLHHYKNVFRLLDAFALVVAERTDLLLVLCGEVVDHRSWDEILVKIEGLKLNQSVRRLTVDRRADLKIVYRGATGVVYPSLAENCPFGLLEAMACGLPIAASRISAMPEIAGDAAIYFDPYCSDDMASVIRRLCGDEALRSELSVRAARRASDFSWKVAAEETLEVFGRLAPAPKSDDEDQ